MSSTLCDGGFALAASDPSFSGRKVLPDPAESNEWRDRVLQLGRRRVCLASPDASIDGSPD
jgi:hypothetical protein